MSFVKISFDRAVQLVTSVAALLVIIVIISLIPQSEDQPYNVQVFKDVSKRLTIEGIVNLDESEWGLVSIDDHLKQVDLLNNFLHLFTGSSLFFIIISAVSFLIYKESSYLYFIMMATSITLVHLFNYRVIKKDALKF